MAKPKHAQNVLDNIRWFAKHRHDFEFSGSDYFSMDKVQIYSRRIRSQDDWSFENEMSRSSFEAAFDWHSKRLPQFKPGLYKEYKVESTSESCVVHDRDGVSAIDAFVQIDSYGVVKPTRQPTLLWRLLKTKASLNLFIKMYAEDRANGRLPKQLFEEEIVKAFGFLPWMVDAVERQRWNFM
jgi:hypothetical protein